MGDRRVWVAACLLAVPLLALLTFWLARPRFYVTGTNSVEDLTYVAPTPPGTPLCLPGLRLPAGTAAIRLKVISVTQRRPALRMTLTQGARKVSSATPAQQAPASRVSNADFPIPETGTGSEGTPARACVTAKGMVNWGGTPLPVPEALSPTVGKAPVVGRVAVWYLPPHGAKASYLSRMGDVFRRAALFRPGIVSAWTYPLLLFGVLPLAGLLALRTLALAVAGRRRRLGRWVYALAALNACCWALMTPAFQAPDEVDHFAYTQSLVERGQTPDPSAASPRGRWSSSEIAALNGMGFFTDHQVGDSRPPWLSVQQDEYERGLTSLHVHRDDGGGYTTSAVHGPLYYYALAPAYLVTRHSSVFSQLTLMRLTSALIGALAALFAFLLGRELAPNRPWVGVLAGLLVAYQPMYGFISGIVNNDVGVNAAAAGLELLLVRLLCRPITVRAGVLTGAVLLALPFIKGTGMSLFPVAALVFVVALWRQHGRRQLPAWAALAATGVVVDVLVAHLLGDLRPSATIASASGGSSTVADNAGAVSAALHNIPDYLSYLWQALLPRLPFMTPHFPPGVQPGFVIFIERGWGAFGWYDVFFRHWVYVVICGGLLALLPLAAWALRREWVWVRSHWLVLLALIVMPAAVIAGFEAAYYTPGFRPQIAEFGRYAFPGIAPLALLAVGALHAFGRRRMVWVGAGLAMGMIFLSYASQVLTLTSFYA